MAASGKITVGDVDSQDNLTVSLNGPAESDIQWCSGPVGWSAGSKTLVGYRHP